MKDFEDLKSLASLNEFNFYLLTRTVLGWHELPTSLSKQGDEPGATWHLTVVEQWQARFLQLILGSLFSPHLDFPSSEADIVSHIKLLLFEEVTWINVDALVTAFKSWDKFQESYSYQLCYWGRLRTQRTGSIIIRLFSEIATTTETQRKTESQN